MIQADRARTHTDDTRRRHGVGYLFVYKDFWTAVTLNHPGFHEEKHTIWN